MYLKLGGCMLMVSGFLVTINEHKKRVHHILVCPSIGYPCALAQFAFFHVQHPPFLLAPLVMLHKTKKSLLPICLNEILRKIQT